MSTTGNALTIQSMSMEWLEKIPRDGLIYKAYEFARVAHSEGKRLSGEPYITHCLEVARIISEWNLGEAAVAAAFLHDVVEDTSYSLEDIEKEFGAEIAFLVGGLTKLTSVSYPESADAESLRRFVVSFTKDLRVLLIKLADRLHNLKTLDPLPPERRKKFAWETIEIYAPLAYRLGMQKLSGELEDLAFPYAYPEEYKWLSKEIKEDYAERQNYAQRVVPIVLKNLKEHGIEPLSVDSRAKRYYSLYKKLLRYDMNLENVTDLVALRIILKTIEECYAALGVIHQIWAPLPNRFKNYIARPKPNGYRSLHTTVFALDNKVLEIQIRTQEMHETNEYGIAAHWGYDQAKKSLKVGEHWQGIRDKKELLWMEQLQNWQNAMPNSQEFLDSLKMDFFKERIFVLTPENDIIDLPAGATPIDFAYRIHSDIGNQCVGAKVNGKIVPLDYELETRDVVEIIVQKNKKPSEDWLRFVKTSLAKRQVRESLNVGKKNLKKKLIEKYVEFKIINTDRPGYLKEATGTFAESRINITDLHSQTDHRLKFSTVTVRCDLLTDDKIQKILVRIKKLAGTKEVNYKISR